MKISTKGRYALRVMLDLAINQTGEFVPLKDISLRQEITVKYLEQIISPLIKAGYLRSSRGNGGGYRLAKDPKDYRVGDILRVTEGDLSVVACLDGNDNNCSRQENCLTLSFWQNFNKIVQEYVDSVTLEDLLQQSENSYYAASI
ncbi:RrF2 family transcriptional regulator [Scatolibacter rhodanostii]|uniref:RrF2 family transcriptional regulator n=1 Tax=Scatolibacter rhodanostii TaxID=2014781 RepID=UPI000C083C2D|nr:Rrf2 family transcriptional regulator [Scatolibacter rhodanostii]